MADRFPPVPDRGASNYLRFLDPLGVSLTVVRGFRRAVAAVTNRPVIAERWRLPPPLRFAIMAFLLGDTGRCC